MSWKPEVFVEGKWCQNGQAFSTKEEAEKSAFQRFFAWFLCDDHRAVEVDTLEFPVNYEWVDGIGDVLLTERM
jgi:hypothetical protein